MFLAIHLFKQFDVAAKDMGYYFAFLSIPYFLSALIVSNYFNSVPRKLLFVMCFCLSTIGMMFLGPSQVLGFPNEKVFLMVGLLILGLVQALVFVPTLPEAIAVIQHKYKIVEKSNMELDNKLNDVMGSIICFIFNFFGFIGPIIGGWMYDIMSKNENTSYRITLDINMFFELIMVIVFLVFNCGLLVFKNTQQQQADLDKMNEITLKLVEHDKIQAKSSKSSSPKNIV